MKKKRIGQGLILLGCLCLLGALGLTGYNLYRNNRAEKASESILQEWQEVVLPDDAEIPDYLLDPEMDMPIKVIDGLEIVGTVTIPSLDISLPIINEWSLDYAEIAPCRYVGSVYRNDLVLAAHNSDAHFGNLKNLEEGAEVIIKDAQDHEFRYVVSYLDLLQPTAIEEMVNTEGNWDLTLFTCTYGGTARVTVRCVRSE